MALLRASGIPAQYVQGELNTPTAQVLIESMFPEPYQLIGRLPEDAEISDPLSDSELLSETKQHFWVEFQPETELLFFDPSFAETRIGDSFAAAEARFPEVDERDRHKVTVSLVTETYSAASAAFGVGDGLSERTVIDETWLAVELVGRPISLGHFVDSRSLSAPTLLSVTHTYRPFLSIGDDAVASSNEDDVVTGADYQEVLTNFPFGVKLLTGLFLQVTIDGPQGSAQSLEHTVLDRIGFATRQGLGSPNAAIDPDGTPAISEHDVTTLTILGGSIDPSVVDLRMREITKSFTEYEDALRASDSRNVGVPIPQLGRAVSIARTRLNANQHAVISDALTSQLATLMRVKAYFSQPRVIVSSARVQRSESGVANVVQALDLVGNKIRAIAAPGQTVSSAFVFNYAARVH